jgi:hypothetical protein
MRKRLLTLLLLPFLLPLSSCRKESYSVPLLHYEDSVVTANGKERYLAYQVTLSDIREAMKTKQSFFVLVYAAGCGTCDLFSIIVQDYIKTNHAVIPYLLLSAYGDPEGLPTISDTTFLFFKDGAVRESILAGSLKNDSQAFASMMKERVADSEVSLLNVGTCLTYAASPFPTYTLNTRITGPDPSEGVSYFPYSLTALRNAQSSVLYLQKEKVSDFTELTSLLLSSDHPENLAFIDEELSVKTMSGFNSEIGIGQAIVLGAYTEVTYAEPVQVRTGDTLAALK